MFSTDQNLSSLKDLIVEIKAYISMRYDLVKLDFVSKLTILSGTLLLCIVLMFLIGTALWFLSFSAAQALAAWMDSESLAFLVIAGIYLLAALALFRFRKQLVIRPIARFLSELFLTPDQKEEDDHEKA